MEDYSSTYGKYLADKKKARVEFNAKIRNPDAMCSIEDAVFGFWHVKSGVMCGRVYRDGYNPEEMRLVGPIELAALEQATRCPATDMVAS